MNGSALEGRRRSGGQDGVGGDVRVRGIGAKMRTKQRESEDKRAEINYYTKRCLVVIRRVYGEGVSAKEQRGGMSARM